MAVGEGNAGSEENPHVGQHQPALVSLVSLGIHQKSLVLGLGLDLLTFLIPADGSPIRPYSITRMVLVGKIPPSWEQWSGPVRMVTSYHV